MDIQFEWDTILEEDKSWDALFVLLNGQWRSTQVLFGTEDKEEVIKKIKENEGL